MSSPSTFECFGLVIHGLGWPEAEASMDEAASAGRQTWIVTANPEIMLSAKRDPKYWQTLRRADLRLVDGFGLQIAGWFFGAEPRRLSGVELAEQLLNKAIKNGWSVAFIGGAKGVADKAAWEMRKKYPDMRIYAEEGGTVGPGGIGDEANEEALGRLTQLAPDVLLVALNHPRQEAWIARHLAGLPSVKIAMGVGGTFDYWAGKKMRAPGLFRKIGLEWLWRLILEPKRWRRILDAVILFPFEFAWEKIKRS